MRLKLFFLVLVILFVNFNSCNAAISKRKKIVQYGDLMVGALIPVHEQPSFGDNEEAKIGFMRKCGVIRDQYGVQRVEALLYILDKINNKNLTKLLPGIKLGLEIRDECWDSSIALEETIDFIKDTIASDENEYDDNQKSPNTTKSFSNENDSKCQILKEKQNQNRILAVIGPGGSTVTINVQNLLQLFDIPQLGYSATSIDLSDKQMFKSFIRVVPSDYLQVRAMVDFVVKMNWTYLFAIYTDGSYGQSGMEAFRNETSYLNICLALYEKMREYASEEDYEVLVRKMNKTANARVIVCFCYGETVRGLLGAINKLKLKGRFIIIGSDGWSDRIDVAIGYYEEAIGSFSLKAFSPLVTEFDNYFASLTPTNNLRNVWFTEYWEERFKCFIEEESKKKFKEPCKKTCPSDFINIGINCFWFSNQNLNWKDAQEECTKQHTMSDLMDINDQYDFHQVLEHIATTPNNRFKKIHTQMKLSSGFNNNSNENHPKIEHYEGMNYFDEQNIKLKLCKTTDIEYKSEFSNDFEASIADEDVITFFNSKIYHTPPYLSLEILENEESNEETKRMPNYCIEINNYEKKLPFVCKLEAKHFKSENSFYRNSLKNYQQDPKMSYVINSALAIVNGLDRVHQNYCNGVSGLCEKMKKVNGSQLLKFIKETAFVGILNEKIYFDINGDPPGRYVILNVQKEMNKFNSTPRYFYKEVGSWNNQNKIELNLKAIVLPNHSKHTQFKSVCSSQCEFGHVKQIKQGGLKCCWNCKRCENHSYVLDEYACNECDLGFWPNKNLTGCEKLPLSYIQWNDASSLFALLVSIIGFIINSFIAQIFVKYSNTCVVKSTTKELSFIILVGVYLCYLMTIPLILKPTLITCYLYRILPGFSLSLMYGALLTKTNRIARILSRSKKIILTHKPKFMSLTSQIVITCIIISVECGLIVIVFMLEPGSYEVTYPQRNSAKLQCFNSRMSIIGPLGYNMMLVAFCTIYAVRTRNLPENFNEAKFIGFSMYTTCVIWLAFIPLYFGSDFKVLSLCLCTSFSATVILIFLFMPKVYIILFQPEKNQRSAFATSKDIRCHFGSSGTASNNIIEPDKQSSFIDSLGNVKNNVAIASKNKNFRYAHRTKYSSLKLKSNKSVDSFEASSSIYQINDMSCQTSMELLEPFVENELKRRKKNRTISITDEILLQEESKHKNDHSTNLTSSNINLKSLSNLFSLSPIHKTKHSINGAESEEDQVSELVSSRKNTPKNFFTKSLKSFKNKNVKLNMSFRSKLDETLFKSLKNKTDLTSKNARAQTENYISSEEEVNEMSIFEIEEAAKNGKYTDRKSVEISIKTNESLEDFKKVFAKNQNLIVNCDNVQSSGYL